MNIAEIRGLHPDVPRFKNDPRDWEWEAAVSAAKAQEAYSESGDDPYHAVFLGSVMSIMPSGKYWTWWACGNVDEDEKNHDLAYHELLEDASHLAGGWIENGLNGDYCDMFFAIPAEENQNDNEESD